MKIIKNILLLAIIFSALGIFANAQLCGSFGVTLNIHDNDLKPVTGYTIRILPWDKDELKGDKFQPAADKPGTAEIKLLEGHVVTGKYKLTISAPGFIDTEKSMTFPHCTRLSYDVLMLRKKEKYRTVTGHITDDQGRSVAYAGITFTGADGTERYISSDFIGNYEIKLKPGSYKLAMRSTYYVPFIREKFVVPEDGRLEFNVLLKSK
jgi:hypothetical protein